MSSRKASETEYYYDERKSSAGRKTISDLVQNNTSKRLIRTERRGVIAEPVMLPDKKRSLSDIQYDRYDKDKTYVNFRLR